MPRQTFAQKACARASGLPQVTIGAIVDARPDRILSHDNTAAIATIFTQFELEHVQDPEKLAITLDHSAPPPTPMHARNHAEIRDFVARQGDGVLRQITQHNELWRILCDEASEELVVLGCYVEAGVFFTNTEARINHCRDKELGIVQLIRIKVRPNVPPLPL